jgi:hypothetical protein
MAHLEQALGATPGLLAQSRYSIFTRRPANQVMALAPRLPAAVGRVRIAFRLSPEARIHWALRIAVAMCFIGHGAFGIMNGGKAEWLVFFDVFHIPHEWAWRFMPVIGSVDISVGLVTLFYPQRAFLLHAAVWGLFTATLRPAAGQGAWEEVLERAGNYGVPLAMLYLTGMPGHARGWLGEKARTASLRISRAQTLQWVLRISTALLLLGHGGFGLFMHKAVWARYLGAVGIGPEMVQTFNLIAVVGLFEILLGVAVLLRPGTSLLVFVLAWKLGTEHLRTVVGEPIFEFIERGGSYGAPLALLLVTGYLAGLRRDAAGESVEERAGYSLRPWIGSAVTPR